MTEMLRDNASGKTFTVQAYAEIARKEAQMKISGASNTVPNPHLRRQDRNGWHAENLGGAFIMLVSALVFAACVTATVIFEQRVDGDQDGAPAFFGLFTTAILTAGTFFCGFSPAAALASRYYSGSFSPEWHQQGPGRALQAIHAFNEGVADLKNHSPSPDAAMAVKMAQDEMAQLRTALHDASVNGPNGESEVLAKRVEELAEDTLVLIEIVRAKAQSAREEQVRDGVAIIPSSREDLQRTIELELLDPFSNVLDKS